MPAYVVPAYIKPRSKIATWLLPMAYLDKEMREYICDLGIVSPVIRDQIIYFTDYTKLVMKKDLEGQAEQYKIHPKVDSRGAIPIESFVDMVTQKKELLRFKGTFNLLGRTGDELIRKVYYAIRPDVRFIVATPLQWLVWIPSKRMLTRLCWLLELKGEIVVRPYGDRNFLLEVVDADGVKLDKVNDWDTFEIKKNITMKLRLSNEWRSLVATEQLETYEAELPVGAEETEAAQTEAPPAEVGEIQ